MPSRETQELISGYAKFHNPAFRKRMEKIAKSWEEEFKWLDNQKKTLTSYKSMMVQKAPRKLEPIKREEEVFDEQASRQSFQDALEEWRRSQAAPKSNDDSCQTDKQVLNFSMSSEMSYFDQLTLQKLRSSIQ